MTPRRLLFVISHAPHRGALASELLDELLVGAVFEQKVADSSSTMACSS